MRARQVALIPTGNPSVQANAMLNFTPECSPVALSKSNLSPSENRELVASVLRLVRAWYVEPITPERETAMARGAVKGMLNSLADMDSHFLDPGERKLLDDAADGKYHGIGAILALRNENKGGMEQARIVVVAPMPGSPAEAAGLKAGDSITYVGEKWIITHNPFDTPDMKKLAKGFLNREINEAQFKKASNKAADMIKNGITIADALDILTAKDKEDTSVTVDRPGQSEPVVFKKVALGVTKVDSVTSKMIGHNIMYIHIAQFNAQSKTQFSAQLDAAMKSAHRPKAIVLDLRDNPGGQMDAAKSIASRFTGGGAFASIQEKGRRNSIKTQKVRGLGIPIAVLVNGGTASVSELVAGDLNENISAALVGTKTFGDGLAQTPLTLRDGSEAVLTTGRMLTSHGVDFNGKGLVPTKLVSDDKNHGDAQLSEAEKILQAKLGRA